MNTPGTVALGWGALFAAGIIGMDLFLSTLPSIQMY